MCDPARLIVTSSASSPLMRSASSTAFLIASTAASGLTMTPLRKPRASASPMPTISSKPPSPGSPAIHVTLLVPMSRPIVCCVRLAIGVFCSLLVLTFAGNQPNDCSLPLAQIDITDHWTTRGLALRVEHRQRFLQTRALFLRAETNLDLRIVVRELHAYVAQILQIHFTHALRETLTVPILLQLE